MNRQLKSSTGRVFTSLLLRSGLALLFLLPRFGVTAKGQSQPETSAASSSIRVKYVLGFEGVKRNANGDFSIQADSLRFVRNGSPAAQVSITSIQTPLRTAVARPYPSRQE